MTTPKLSPAAIYARYSSEMQDDMSISSQIKECTEWAEKNGYYIVAIYTDEATSGTIARDGLNELKTAISSPKCPFEAVIAWKASRIARDVELATGFRGYLRRRNIKLLFVADPNLDGPMSIIVDSILDGFNAFFIEDLAANVLRGQKQWASLGYAPPGNPPYGYKKIPVDSNSDRQKYKYEPIPEQAAILRWMFQQYADGVPLTKIAIELKEKGIKTQNNTPWTCSKIWKLMFAPQRAAYSGSIIFNKKGRNKPEPGDKRPRRNQKTFIKPESEWIVVENAHPPIIEQELFDAVDKMRFGKPERIVFRERMRSGKISMLSGMIRCHNCGHLYGRGLGGSKGHKRYYYKCSAKMHFKDNPYLNEFCPNRWLRAKELETIVINALKVRIAAIKKAGKSNKKITPSKQIVYLTNKKIEQLKQQRETIIHKRENLLDIIAEGLLSKDIIAERLNNFVLAISTIDDEISALEKQEESQQISDKILEIVNALPDGWEDNEESARKVILSLISDIVADDGNITINYRLPGPSETYTIPVYRKNHLKSDTA